MNNEADRTPEQRAEARKLLGCAHEWFIQIYDRRIDIQSNTHSNDIALTISGDGTFEDHLRHAKMICATLNQAELP